ncbi:MAG: hypothetical protein ACI9MJ_000595 [Alphaproteobacteria bacterium]|jgi:hypothetical protein
MSGKTENTITLNSLMNCQEKPRGDIRCGVFFTGRLGSSLAAPARGFLSFFPAKPDLLGEG